jgi:hypothetical protein
VRLHIVVHDEDTQGRTVDESYWQSTETLVQILLAGYAACVAAKVPNPLRACNPDFSRAMRAHGRPESSGTHLHRVLSSR